MARLFPSLSLALLLSAGCTCERPRRCVSADDCPVDDSFCAGEPVCLFDPTSSTTGVCGTRGSPCPGDTFCVEETRSCVPCAEDPTRPACQDAGAPPPVTCEERNPGIACDSFGGCGAASECHMERPNELPTFLPGGGGLGRPLEMTFFPDGVCASRCNANARNDMCGDCARCVGDVLAGSARIPLVSLGGDYEGGDGICRERCTPSSSGTGCERPGYTCDLETSTCMAGCVSDQDCQITLLDDDGNGFTELIDRGAGFPAFCDPMTLRCRTRGAPGARIGDRCRGDEDCPADGRCLFNEGGELGVCGQPGCRAAGFECPAGTVCDVRNIDGGERSACLVACEVGAEEGTPAALGPGGGHPSCGPGLACVFNGTAEGPGPASGSCVPGEYNTVAAPNVGARCDADAQCFSPFGYGACDGGFPTGGVQGQCTVRHCAVFLDEAGEETEGILPAVGLDAPVCDPSRGEECVANGRGTATRCLRVCGSAADCPADSACVEVITGRTYCWPFCLSGVDCAPGRRCVGVGSDRVCNGENRELCTCQP